jgi:hypothetical protein
VGAEIGERQALLDLERARHHHHAPVRIDNTGVGLDELAFAAGFPFQANVDTGIHPATAAFFTIFCAYLLQFAQVERHRGTFEAMLELQGIRVNGTEAGENAKE